MPERGLAYFSGTPGVADSAVAVTLPQAPERVIDAWSGLRARMIRAVPDGFTRDEWAFLIAFLSEESLRRPFETSFGFSVASRPNKVRALFRPRGEVALWLPNNVSLLGPLLVVLVSLMGAPLRVKAGSRSDNLAARFIDFAAESVADAYLADYLRGITCERFDRNDPRNAQIAQGAQVRLVFGGDAAARAVDALPHPLESIGFYFVDRASEAWAHTPCLDDATVLTLLRVFGIFGQAGCTSPRRVLLLDSGPNDALELQRRMLRLWPEAYPEAPPMHVASANHMARQWAAALGWNAVCTDGAGAVIAAGSLRLPACSAPMVLMIAPATAAEAEHALPANIQTIGYALQDPTHPCWLDLIARSSIRRFVPIARMHHFGSSWDGWGFWRALFEEVEVQLA